MGIRADFYVGIGLTAEWIGSVAYDGDYWADCKNGGNEIFYPQHQRSALKNDPIVCAATEQDYRDAVAAMLAANPDVSTTPDMGWPWPWENSNITDYAYAFHEGKFHVFTEKTEWPDMTAKKKLAIGSRSGLLILRLP